MDEPSLTSLSEQEEQEAKEPDVASADPNERKLARRLRIQRRLEAIRRQTVVGSEGDIQEESQAEKRLLDKQIIASTRLLQKLEKEGDELVTNIRVANDSREVDRREAEGISREKIIGHLSEEAEAAEMMFLSVNGKWQSILEYHDPLHIHEAMQEQQKRGNDLLRQKDAIIEMLKKELKRAEQKFTMDQLTQDDDIMILTSRIEKQVTLIREAYRQELKLIEDVIGQERQILKDMCDKKWEEMYKQRSTLEEENLEKNINMLEEFMEEMKQKRINFQETFRENKISLETDIQTLQKELEVMKMTTLMNTERMDYNYQILKKREDENIIINSQQKRKINKLQDQINAMKKKIHDYETFSKNEITRITADIEKLRNKISQAEKKSEHLTNVNDKKFMQIWDLNTHRAANILHKILSTDRILCEQQLGVTYQKPIKALMKLDDLHSYCTAKHKALDQGSAIKKKQSEIANIPGKESEKLDEKAYQRLVRHVLVNISEKTNFLTEQRLSQVLKPYSEEEGILVRLDNVFFALDVRNSAEIDVLLEFFLPYAHCVVCSENETMSPTQTAVSSHESISTSAGKVEIILDVKSELVPAIIDVNGALLGVHQPEHVINDVLLATVDAGLTTENVPLIEASHLEGESSGIARTSFRTTGDAHREICEKVECKSKSYMCKLSHPLVISSVYVLRALREFVTKNSEENKRKASNIELSTRQSSIVSRAMTSSDILHYWRRFREIFTEDRERLWDGLLVGLKKYHAILKDRKEVHEEIVHLKKKNEELRGILRNYEATEERRPLHGPCPNKKFFKYIPKNKTKQRLPKIC